MLAEQINGYLVNGRLINWMLGQMTVDPCCHRAHDQHYFTTLLGVVSGWFDMCTGMLQHGKIE